MKFEIPFIIKQIIQSFQFKVTDADRERVKVKIETFRMLDELNQNLSLLWDYDVNRAVYASNKSFLRTELDADKVRIGYGFMFGLCNLKDYPFLIQMNARSLKVFNDLPESDRYDYVMYAQMRMRSQYDKYEHVNVKQRLFESDSQGNIWMMMVLIEPSLHENPFVPYLENKKTGHKIMLFGNDDTRSSLLTAREKEVVEQLRQDKTASQIAEDLSVDVETIRFHTKNIRKKTKTNSITEALHVLYENEEC